MTEAQKRRRRRWLAYAAGGALTATGAVIALGPGAPWVVEHLGDGARVWRLGYIEIDGVRGRWLGALRAERVAIADEQGVWIEAHDVRLSWSPQEILTGAVRIHAAEADRIAILRRPTLLPPRPSGDVRYDVRIDGVHVDALTLAEDVVGAQAAFTADFAMNLHDKELLFLDARLQRLDSDDDRLVAFYRAGADYGLNVDIYSAPGGVIARALGVTDRAFAATARGAGDAEVGEGVYNATLGDAELLAGAARWDAQRWSSEATLQLRLLPALEPLSRRVGSALSVSAAGARVGDFTAHAETPFLKVDLQGALNEENELEGPARFVATTNRISDIAREAPFDLGPGRLEGELRQARGVTAIQATLDARELDVFGRRARLTGPVRASLSNERFQLTADLRAPPGTPALFANARARTELAYDRERRRFSLDHAEINGDALAFQAQGWVNGDDGEFGGEWRVRKLETLFDRMTGEAGGRWRAFREVENGVRVWTTTVDGAGAGVGGEPTVVAQLLGARPTLDARFRYDNLGVTVSHARIEGEQLRAGATGRIVRGQADLALEASARGPLTLGDADIGGAVDATGRLTGRLARPAVAMQARLATFTAGGVTVQQPAIDFTLSPSERGYAGRADAQGVISGAPLTASSSVAVRDGALVLTEIDAQAAALQAQGNATIASRGVTANLDINGMMDGLVPGVTGSVAGVVALTPERVALDAQVVNARSGDLRVRAATLRAEGPHDAIAGRFALRGRLGRAPLAFEGAATIDARHGPEVTLDGRGVLADADIFTRAPMHAQWRSGGVDASINVAIGDGVVQAQWRERGRALSGALQIDDAPIAPLAAIWDERASGRIDGRMSIANDGRGLSGDADLALTEARFAGRQRGTLDMQIVGNLDPGRLRAVVSATSTDGLVARFEADAPVTTSADPIRIALARERRGRATWSVRGPAESLWAAARLPDQSLQGQLSGEGELAFGAGYLSGDGYIEIVDGRFEDKLTGVTLADLDARIALDQRGATIENFTASGPSGGRLTATGGSADPRHGRIAVTVDDMRIVDRPDARARANGQLALEWEGLHSQLSGHLNIIEADLDIAANPEAGIPTIDVIEINRPGEIDETEEDEDRTIVLRNGSTELDVAIEAPGRVFTRGRGVDAEWSLDLRLQGTARNPLIFGEARAVRGSLSLSGQPFDIEDALITFNGDPLDARINLTATRDTPDLTAYVRLVGTARDPEITFSSDPPLPEDEILPQVLFGRSVEDLSPFEAAQLAASLATLSGRASLDIVGAARAAVGLDRFNIREDEAGGFLVAGGVYLTRDVYVEVGRTGLGQAQTRVEWTVRPRLVLITSFLGNGDQSVSLRWRRESD